MSKFFIFFLLVLVAAVALRLSFYFLTPPKIKSGDSVSFITTITSDPKISNGKKELIVNYGDFWHFVPVTVVLPINSAVNYGDTVEISGKIDERLLNDKTSSFLIYFPTLKAKSGGFMPIFAKIRSQITDFCEKSFSQPYSGLLAGMLLGVKNTLPNSITISFRITGVSHVIAASGMNVTLIAGFLMSFLGRITRRKWALLFSMFGILAYMCLSGLDPSILRAGIMGLLVFGSQLFGRQYTVVYSLFLTSGALLFWDPLLLLDVGFQLSVGATIGIVFLKPLIPLKGFLLDDIGTTIAAQIATLPILLGTFGSYGLLSILVNALVLWTIPLITILGGVGVTLGLIFQPLGQFILVIIFPLLWYFVGVVLYFSQFALVWQISSFPVFLTIGYYLIVVSWVWASRLKREVRN
ncbi:MAG TPA: ComEC/Rec2 family competence protein [Patescibacteria group bacterium]